MYEKLRCSNVLFQRWQYTCTQFHLLGSDKRHEIFSVQFRAISGVHADI